MKLLLKINIFFTKLIWLTFNTSCGVFAYRTFSSLTTIITILANIIDIVNFFYFF